MSDYRAIGIEVTEREGRTVLLPRGDWLARSLGAVDAEMRRIADSCSPDRVEIDVSSLGRIDTAGAFVLSRVFGTAVPEGGYDARVRGEHPSARRLIALTRERAAPPAARPAHGPGLYELFERAGRGLIGMGVELRESMAFFGEILVALGRAALRPHKVRWAAVFHVMEQAGVNALPVIGTLSFFIGAVVAYLGANLLQQFGASVFAVELVGFAVLREFAVVITAILLAGRSDSAFTAQIGAMRMQQEIDAMRTLGLDPMDVLVLPRVIACVAMTPILTFAAMLTGILGGIVVVWSVLGVSPGFFLARMQDAIEIKHFWAGMAKAPVFAMVIAIIGCRQGMLVGNDVESLGHNVTASVVQSIFAVIVIDALFAMAYLELGI
jgi:phospholipid/cholesterol/gamma-HCH transport system permease protein